MNRRQRLPTAWIAAILWIIAAVSSSSSSSSSTSSTSSFFGGVVVEVEARRHEHPTAPLLLASPPRSHSRPLAFSTSSSSSNRDHHGPNSKRRKKITLLLPSMTTTTMTNTRKTLVSLPCYSERNCQQHQRQQHQRQRRQRQRQQQYQHGSNQSRFALFATPNDEDNDNVNDEMTASENDNAAEEEEGETILQSKSEIAAPRSLTPTTTTSTTPPPPFLALGYDIASCLNIIAGIVLLCNINTVVATATTATTSAVASAGAAAASTTAVTAGIISSTDNYRPNLLATYTAGTLGHLFLGAISCSLLSKLSKDRTTSSNSERQLHHDDDDDDDSYDSNTYKRLTFGTLLFGSMGLASLPGESGCILNSSPIMGAGAMILSQFAKFVTAFVSFAGWEHSAGGFGISTTTGGAAANRNENNTASRIENVLRELLRGCKEVYRTLPVTNERPATFYRTFFVFVTLGNIVFNVPELAYNLRSDAGGLFSLSTSLTMSSIARLGYLSVVLYVLKDGAERKKMTSEGKTFVSLNLMVGLWALGVGIAQGLSDGPTSPFNIRRAADKFLFAILFLNNGILSLLSKMGIIKARDDVDDPDADPPLRVVF